MNLEPCMPPIVNTPCSPTLGDSPPLPNDIAFAPTRIYLTVTAGTLGRRGLGSLVDPYDDSGAPLFMPEGRLTRRGHTLVQTRISARPCGDNQGMGIGTSIFLIAVGAVLKFAVTATVSGISLATVGTILIVLGVIGLLISMVFLMQARRGDAVVTRERAL